MLRLQATKQTEPIHVSTYTVTLLLGKYDMRNNWLEKRSSLVYMASLPEENKSDFIFLSFVFQSIQVKP